MNPEFVYWEIVNDFLNTVRRKDVNGVKNLIESYPQFLKMHYGKSETFFQEICMYIPSIIPFCIKYGANINMKNNKGQTVLYYIIQKGLEVPAEVLIRLGANVNIKTDKNQTPLMAAAFSGSLKIVKLLIEYGSDINSVDINGNNAMHYACYDNPVNLNLIEYLLFHTNINYNKKNNSGKTPLESVNPTSRRKVEEMITKKTIFILMQSKTPRARSMLAMLPKEHFRKLMEY
jgi:ankyrin repeat protein